MLMGPTAEFIKAWYSIDPDVSVFSWPTYRIQYGDKSSNELDFLSS